MRRPKFKLTWKTALGEVALIFIGISLAIWFNNWNDNRKREKLEKDVLSQIYYDILSNQGDLNSDLLQLKIGLQSHVNVEKYIREDLAYAGAMCFDFYWLKRDEYTFPVKSGYDNLKSLGLELIRNDSLRQTIQHLYDSGFPRISRATPFHPDLDQYFTEYYQQHFVPNENPDLPYMQRTPYGANIYPYQSDMADIDDKIFIGYVPKDFSALKKDPKFRMMLHQSKEYRRYKIRQYQNVKGVSEYLIERIGRELNIQDQETLN